LFFPQFGNGLFQLGFFTGQFNQERFKRWSVMG
jgi:hypothetical protein